jgi:uncharacterized membrane protein
MPAPFSRRRLFRGALLAALLLLGTFPAAARQLSIQNFRAEIAVLPDGTIDVTETIQARFTGSWRGLYRTIPVEYRSPQGFNYTLLLEPISVTDDAGHTLRYESSRERHYRKFKIYVPGAEDATRTIVLRYRVLDGLRFFEDHDELYWNITGDEWDVPIESASAQVVLPAGVTGLRALTFSGSYGSREREATVDLLGSGVEIRMRRSLAFHEGLTAVIGWDKGFVQPPSAAAKTALFLRSNWPLFIPIGVFAIMFWLWFTRGRDPRLRPIAAQYAPPADMTPAEAGTLVDNSADMRDITATIVDLAVRGYILIEEKEKEHLMGLWSNKEYVFHLRKKPNDWGTALKAHELDLLNGLFDNGAAESVELSELQNTFYKNLPGIRNSIFDALLSRGYYVHRPDRVKKGYLIAGVLVGFLMVWGGGALSASQGMAPAAFITAGIATGVVICAFGWFMPARTAAGARTLEGVLGFEDFLGHVEADRMERMIKTPEMFEKFLPFAMALGVEKKWVTAFQDVYREPPGWYRGSYGPNFYPMGFVHDLDQMSTRASSVLASAPRSSGGSGFAGGGFSGGGFGGGGGGGF